MFLYLDRREIIVSMLRNHVIASMRIEKLSRFGLNYDTRKCC